MGASGGRHHAVRVHTTLRTKSRGRCRGEGTPKAGEFPRFLCCFWKGLLFILSFKDQRLLRNNEVRDIKRLNTVKLGTILRLTTLRIKRNLYTRTIRHIDIRQIRASRRRRPVTKVLRNNNLTKLRNTSSINNTFLKRNKVSIIEARRNDKRKEDIKEKLTVRRHMSIKRNNNSNNTRDKNLNTNPVKSNNITTLNNNLDRLRRLNTLIIIDGDRNTNIMRQRSRVTSMSRLILRITN